MSPKFKKLLCSALISFIPTIAWAQDFTTSATVIDATFGEPAPNASYKIFLLPDTATAIVNNVTDIDGHLLSTLNKAGDYLLTVDFTGKKPVALQFEISQKSPVANLGVIPLYDNEEALEELVVVGKRPLIQSDGATLTYNTTEDATAKTSNILDMLRKVPMVTVDADDNIQINGQSNFQVYLNGRPNPMLAANASTIFKAMPASMVKKVEVITEPGAKYDAEGSGGILNIVTESREAAQAASNGYFGQINASLARNSSQAGAYLSGKYKKVTAQLNLNYYTSQPFKFDRTSATSEIEYLKQENIRYIRESMTMSPDFQYAGASINLSWEPDTANLFNFSFNGNLTPVSLNTTTFNGGYNAGDILQYSFNRNIDADINNNGISTSASYQHSFGRQGHNVILSYQYDFYKNYTNNAEYYNEFFNYSLPDSYKSQYDHALNNSHTIQADYVNPFNDLHKLEAGFKTLLRYNNGNSWTSLGASPENMIVDEDNHIKMRQYNDVYALYATYSLTLKKWAMTAGLRYEHTNMGGKFEIGDYENFQTKLNDVVPNAAISYAFGPANNLRAAYQMRISRPSLQQVNPFRSNMQNEIIEYGNPLLKSEKNHNVSLTYTNFSGRVGGNIRLNYMYVDNLISDYMFAVGSSAYQTYMNAGTQNQFSLQGYLNWNIIFGLNLGIGAGLRYNDFNVEHMSMHNSGWNANFNGNLTWQLPAKFMVSAYAGGATKSTTLQGSFGSYSYHGISVKKSFLKDDKLDISISAQNFFNPTNTFVIETITESLISRSTTKNSTWSIGLSVAFKFGNLNSNVRRTDASIENDDISSASGGSLTGGNGGATGGGIGN